MNPGSYYDYDWTLVPNRDREHRLREIRNRMIQDSLMEGLTVAYRSSGWSLYPLIHSNDLCYFEPVYAQDVRVGDIVFCQVEPGGRFYAHRVLAKRWDWDARYNWNDYCFWIGNMKGRCNGWCFSDQVYGRLYWHTH